MQKWVDMQEGGADDPNGRLVHIQQSTTDEWNLVLRLSKDAPIRSRHQTLGEALQVAMEHCRTVGLC